MSKQPDHIEEQPWFHWMEGAVRTMYDDSPTSILLAARLGSGDTMTAYYRTDMEGIAAMLAHIRGDMVLDFIAANADVIKDILEDTEDIEEGDEEE